MAVKVGKVTDHASAPVLYEDLVAAGMDVTQEINDLVYSARIDGNNLEEEALDQPARFSRVGALAEEAASDARYAKKRLDIAKAEADARIRRDAQTDGGKKPTETQIEMMIAMDERIISLTDEWLEAERCAGILAVFKQSFRDRKDMIAELMRDRRAEHASYGAGIAAD